MTKTKIENLVNPQVMADMINATLPAKIKFTPLAKVDSTLTARAGNTITVPKYAYIGEAEDVAEGVAMGTTVLTATTTTATVKKAGKAVELTDEAVLSGYGDPIGEATSQLRMSIADKVNSDCYAALKGASLTYDGSAGVISYSGIVKAVDLFEEEVDDSVKVMVVHPKQVTTLRLDEDFKSIDKYPLKTVMTGTIGEIAGCQVVPSKKVALEDGCYVCPIVVTTTEENEQPALTIYMKRGVELETDRDILAKTTVISVDEHYTAVLSNEAKVVAARFKA
ncbi:MAG: N4-gp56 family major capsid protein [Selenomonadales bacterium]|nr:N4-gp56 family major capsid protein [Selenomonadales bacterium]